MLNNSRKIFKSTNQVLNLGARNVSGKSKDGAVKEEGGSFSKKGEADENAFFHKLGTEQLKKIKNEEKVLGNQKDDNEKKKK